jgi:AAT family amino acid transporter/D-serine/D-alanine/glycine transporter
MRTEEPQLSKALSNRHIQFIALGGAIGASLFMGSGAGIRTAGPAILIAYLLAGAAVYLMARAMGELLLAHPNAPSFTAHVDRYLGRWAGFVAGWSYWLIWALVSILELTAVGMLVRYWAPTVPQWIPALIALAALYGVNRLTVRLFGEMEFWLTLVKILTILVLIFGGAVMAIWHLGPAGEEASITKLWSFGGFFPNGLTGFLAVLPLAVFAFGGTELIGVTAAEAEAPERSVPRAINGVILRILIFYIGALAVIMMVADWRSLDPSYSPFVLVFDRAGLAAAGDLVNFVVLTAIISSLNSGIFATGRMLFSLALQGDAHPSFGRLDERKLPANGINLSALVMLCGVGLNYLFPEQVFGFMMSVIAALLLLTWTFIVLAHLRFRKSHGAWRAFVMPAFPVASFIVLGFYFFVAVLMCLDPGSRPTVYSFLIWLIGISLAFFLFIARRRRPKKEPA